MTPETATIKSLTDVLHKVAKLAFDYHTVPNKELVADLLLYAYLTAKFHSVSVSRQHHVRMYGSTYPHRIDFRIGGTNPVVAEFVLRPPTGGGQLYARANRPELRKLCRVYATQAKLRILLLLDLHSEPLQKGTLKASYEKVSSGRGKFKRYPVRVLYVNREDEFDFIWRP
jgi:hypothetical protein